MKIFIRLMLGLMISFTLVESPLIQGARAQMISTTDALAAMTRADSQARVAGFLEREDVKNQMMKLGVSAEEASLRLASLSDAELQEMALQIEQGRAGGEVVGLLMVVLLVILIIYFAKRI